MLKGLIKKPDLVIFIPAACDIAKLVNERKVVWEEKLSLGVKKTLSQESKRSIFCQKSLG